MATRSRSGGFRALLRGPDFRRLCVSQIFGGMGEWLATLALMAVVWDRTRSAFISGIVLALRILPAAVIGSALAGVVDRFDRRRVLISSTAGRALIYGSLPLVGGVAPVLALALVAEVATLAYMAARDATLPRLVPREQLSTANALTLVSSFGSMPVGSGLFAALGWLQAQTIGRGHGFALFASAAMLTVATLMIGRIAAAVGVVTPAGAREPQPGAAVTGRAALREILRADPVLRRVMVGGLIVACCAGSLLTLGLSYVRETLHAGPAAYSALITCFCAGAALGVAVVSRMREQLAKLFHVSSAAMGAILLAMAVFPSTVVGYGMAFLFGIAGVATFLGGITLLQDRVHDAARGKAFTMAHSGIRVIAVSVGLVAAWAAHRLGRGDVVWTLDGTQVMLSAAGLALLVAGVILLRPARRPLAA